MTQLDDWSISSRMSEDTKQIIIAIGADIIHRKGFNNTGIQEILKACGVPKGSFYYYFESKEAFGVEVARYFAARLGEKSGHLLKDKSFAPLDRLKNFFRFFRNYFEEQGWSRGCPIGNLAQEMGDLSGPLQVELSQIVNGLVRAVAPIIREAAESGQISESIDPECTAGFIVAAWHGAVLQMKVHKCSTPLDNFEQIVFENILVK
ncbi:TetR family transcriptional regulator C-terminal domain-containing protein [Maridesulfovibrio sp. FT414]|uniref:TetR/AcrR family transcriptional regulator n=1 Tax=Maridesulfovibrio sp. FT414 TaxID=2979469 RepID=UPI003D8089C7